MKEYVVSNVQKLRKDQGVTQEDLAEAVGVSRQTIIAIEKGNYTPSILLGLKIAHFFKQPLEKVFTYKHEK